MVEITSPKKISVRPTELAPVVEIRTQRRTRLSIEGEMEEVTVFTPIGHVNPRTNEYTPSLY